MNKKNIAIIIGSLKGGGAERIAGLLSIELTNNYNVFLFVRDVEEINYSYGGKMVPFCDAYNSTNDNEYLVETVLRILKKKYKIDVAISFLDTMNIANIRSAEGEKIIISSRCAYENLYKRDSEVIKHEMKRFFPLADKVVACSYGVKQELVNDYKVEKDRVTAIYNFIDADSIRSQANISADMDMNFNPIEGRYFVNVGRLTYQKNQITLIRGFKRLVQQRDDDLKLVIIGNGDYREQILDEIKELDLLNRVILIPYCKNPFVVLKDAVAFVFTSIFEGFPNAVLEALALGVPVISSDCISGPREILNDDVDYSTEYPNFFLAKRGILIGREKDCQGFSDADFCYAMNWVLMNQEKTKSIIEAGIEYINNYSNKEIIRQWIDAIEEKNTREGNDLREIISNENEALSKASKVFIYGAGKVAKRVYYSYRDCCIIESFLVTEIEEGNQSTLFGIPVYELGDADIEKTSLIIIGVGLRFLDEVISTLHKKGFDNVIIPF